MGSRDRRNRSRSRDRSYRRRRRTRTPPVSRAMEKINREEKDANDDQNNSTENRSLNVENGNNMGKDLQENGEKKYGLILPVSKKHLEARQSDDYSKTVFAEGNDDRTSTSPPRGGNNAGEMIPVDPWVRAPRNVQQNSPKALEAKVTEREKNEVDAQSNASGGQSASESSSSESENNNRNEKKSIDEENNQMRRARRHSPLQRREERNHSPPQRREERNHSPPQRREERNHSPPQRREERNH